MDVRENHKYQAYYCEENVWQLCQETRFAKGTSYAVFLSNPSKQCAVWFQRAAPSSDQPVVWDYHVIFLHRPPEQTMWWIWDLDTTLAFPMPAPDYLARTFWGTPHIPPEYAPWFRVLSASDYIQILSTDRSHMLDPQGHYREPPPPWPAPFQPSHGMNLMSFLDITTPFHGEVLALLPFVQRFGTLSPKDLETPT